jgi:hypothetical protein
MYIPKPPEGVKIYGYDVNSLYPSRMKDCLMPIGTPSYFEGDIRLISPNAFGFFYCKIIAPDNLTHPILQTRVNTNGGVRTIAPLGGRDKLQLIGLYENLKGSCQESIDIFNFLIDKNIENEGIFKSEHKIQMLRNLNIIKKELTEANLVIPDYDLKLYELHELNLGSKVETISTKSTSPKLLESSIELSNLNTQVEEN